MARIDWVLVCDLAYFDRYARMCTVGITTNLIVRALPIHLREIMMVARVVDQQPGDEIDISVGVQTPSGLFAVPSTSDNLHIEVAREYVLVTIRDLPLNEEGVYAFQVKLGTFPAVGVDVPVLAIPQEQLAEVH
jgi:hypothetical protein